MGSKKEKMRPIDVCTQYLYSLYALCMTRGDSLTAQQQFEVGQRVKFCEVYSRMFPDARLTNESGVVIEAGSYHPDNTHIQFDDGTTTDSKPEYLVEV